MKSNKPKYYLDNVKKIKKDSVVIEETIFLADGKTTPKGEYPKLNSDDKCCFQERASCNYGEFFSRCEFMKFDCGMWRCIFKENA